MRIEGKGKENNMVGWWSTLSWSSDTFHNFFLSFPTASVIDAAFKFFFWMRNDLMHHSMHYFLKFVDFPLNFIFFSTNVMYIFNADAELPLFHLCLRSQIWFRSMIETCRCTKNLAKLIFFNFMTSIIQISPVPVE